MLRVGLTGGLGAGKSAVGLVWAEAGVHVLSADEIGRRLMQPGEAVFRRIVEHFGPAVVGADGQLDRARLAEEAFGRGRLAELNALVHPPVLATQGEALERLEAENPGGMAAVESALIFEVGRGADVGRGAGGEQPWAKRFDRIVLVTAPAEARVARYVARMSPEGADDSTRLRLEADARRRLAQQMSDEAKRPLSDYVIENTGSLVLLRRRALEVLRALRAESGQAARVSEGAQP